MREYEELFAYVRDILEKSSVQGGKRKSSIGYSRFSHIERVYSWAKRILSELSADITIHKETVLLASIFHDAGYGVNEDNYCHAEESAKICEAYLKEKGYDCQLINQVVYLVRNHSKKELLEEKNTPIELLVLMEADLLDDTAALGLVMDAMIVMRKRKPDFHKIYQHMLKYSAKQIKINPMVTEPAKRFWKEKQKLTEEFIRQLARDLNIT